MDFHISKIRGTRLRLGRESNYVPYLTRSEEIQAVEGDSAYFVVAAILGRAYQVIRTFIYPEFEPIEVEQLTSYRYGVDDHED